MFRVPPPPPELRSHRTRERAKTSRALRWAAIAKDWLLGVGRRLAEPGIARTLLFVGAAMVLVVVVLGLVSGALIRVRVAKEADRRGLDVEVSAVRLGMFAVSLEGVRLRPRGIGGLEAQLDKVRVELGGALSVRSIVAIGGSVSIDGDVDEVLERLRALRGGNDSERAPVDKADGRRVAVEDLSVAWSFPSGSTVTARGVGFVRETDTVELSIARCTGTYRNITLDAAGAEASFDRAGLHRARAKALNVGYVGAPSSASAKSPSAPAQDLVPPPLPAAARKRGPASPAKSTLPEPNGERVLPEIDLHALRAQVGTLLAIVLPRLPDGAAVEIDGLSTRLDIGGEPIAFGPGAFSLERRNERIRVGFSSARAAGGDSAAVAGATPLSLDADLPVGGGEITARLAGGPVSLSALGVRDGMRGLSNVSRANISGKGQLVLSEMADALTFDGEVRFHDLSMTQPRLAPEPLRGMNFALSARGLMSDRGRLRLDDGQLDMGALHVRAHGTVEETAEHLALSLAIDVAPAACQALLDSAPLGLLPVVRPSRMSGTFGAALNLSFDTRAIEKLGLDYRISDQCRMVEVPPELSRERFDDAFTYRTYKPDGSTSETTTGPGTKSWTPLDDISPFMISAVLTTEDAAFYKHKGFNHSAIRSSVQANLKARRFVRGASTITMQLAKNLFLAREKALSRKIEEVILTDYLEQIFRKDDMMELYLNVVEFGPDVYGITQAAAYYFGRKPEELQVAECFFLASLLPSPIRYGKLRDKGVISEPWMRHLRALLEIAAKNGKISRAELEEGLKEPVVFVRPGDPPPEPRKPVTSRRTPFDDDAAWRSLD